MKKVVFDTSIHLGQFCINSEKLRKGCKNSQVAISSKPSEILTGIVSFNENSWADHIIWDLQREEQDTFYKFMDVFHSVKNIIRVPISFEELKLVEELKNFIQTDISNLLTCATAINNNASEIHTHYESFNQEKIKTFLKEKYNIILLNPLETDENTFPENDLEHFYQDTLSLFIEKKINLPDFVHK